MHRTLNRNWERIKVGKQGAGSGSDSICHSVAGTFTNLIPSQSIFGARHIPLTDQIPPEGVSRRKGIRITDIVPSDGIYHCGSGASANHISIYSQGYSITGSVTNFHDLFSLCLVLE